MIKKIIIGSAVCLSISSSVKADLIQHLDASVVASVTANDSSLVTNWTDQSDKSNHAVRMDGSVYFPSSPLTANGMPGLDFGVTRNTLQLMSTENCATLLDFSVPENSKSGFSVLVAFKVAQMALDTQYAIGTGNLNGNFSISVSANGTIQLTLKKTTPSTGTLKVLAGDTVIVGMTYSATSGVYHLWESKNRVLSSHRDDAYGDYRGNALRLGEANPNINSRNYLRGIVGEVKIFNQAFTSERLLAESEAMADKWLLSNLIQYLDASVSESVVTSSAGTVTQWTDQSGRNNHAAPFVSAVNFPSTSHSNTALVGVNFKNTRTSISLFDAPASQNWLNLSGGTGGFCVLLAFKCDELITDWSDLIGNSSVTSEGFGMRYSSAGTMQAFLNGPIGKAGGTVASGDTIVFGFNYNAATGAYEFWDSKNNSSVIGSKFAANFSTGNHFTLGSTTSANRYLNGMVGTVKIFNKALGVSEFKSERGKMAAKWVNGWRVIPLDIDYPTDDVIVAYASVTDPIYNLPSDTANTDCTASIQAALDAAKVAGGGTVFVPDGQYRIDGTLMIPSNVILRGRWRKITATQQATGTILALYSAGTSASIQIAGNGCGVRDLTFWQPSQVVTASTATAYPFVIAGASGQTTIENITLVNAYKGIDLSSSSMCCLRGIYGSPLIVGLTADRSYAVSRYIDIHFSPDYWVWSRLPGSPSSGGLHQTYTRTNGVAIHIKEMDGFHLIQSSVSGYQKGILFEEGASGDNPWGSIANTTISSCNYGIHFKNAKSVPILHSTIQADNIAVWAQNHNPSLNSCSISSPEFAFYSSESQNVNLTNSIRNGAVSLGTGILTEGNAIPTPTFNMAYERIRQPLKNDLFNVMDFGAIGDGLTDDTTAFQSAVAAANENAGGIVFVPAGQYVMKGNLSLAAGVELRGNSGGRHIASTNDCLGSLLLVKVGAGHSTGTPFITMGDLSGIRGIAFHYPDQTWEAGFVAYPYMLQGNGLKNYIIDCFASNPYQAAEFNGDDHLVEFSFFGGLRRTFRANSCRGGRIQFCHIKPDFWRDIWMPGHPASDLELFKWNVTNEGLEVFYLNDCIDYSISSIFNHASRTLFTANNSSGQTLLMGGEQLQQGYSFMNGTRRFDMLQANCNVNSIGNGSGTHGIKTFQDFKGHARFFSSGVQGSAMDAWAVEDGLLYLQNTSVSGPSNRGPSRIVCESLGKMILERCSSPDFIGFQNQGSVSMKKCSFSKGFVNQALPPFLADNAIEKTYILSDSNQNPFRSYGLALSSSNILFEDALMFPAEISASASTDARRVQAARLISGSYIFDVTDPDFTNGLKPKVTIESEWYVDTDCTLSIFYRTQAGMKLGKIVSYSGAASPGWQKITFNVTDALFDSSLDVRVDVEGRSPGLATFAIQSAQLPSGHPASPTGLVATQATGIVHLDWEDNTEGNLAGYNVYRSSTAGGLHTAISSGIAASSYANNNVENDTIYYYKVTALDTNGNESYPSPEVSARPSSLYTTWTESYGGEIVIGLPDHDYDGDGSCNLLEYAFGTNPADIRSFEQPIIGMTTAPAHITFSFFRAQSDIAYTIEASTDLSNWSPIFSNPGTIGQRVTVIDPLEVFISGPSERFLRLSAKLK